MFSASVSKAKVVIRTTLDAFQVTDSMFVSDSFFSTTEILFEQILQNCQILLQLL